MHELLLFLIGLTAGIAGPVSSVSSLISFPALLLMNFEPISANVTNTIGQVSVGTFSSAMAYRHDMKVTRRIASLLVCAASVGGLIGAVLLIMLGKRVFVDAVPILLIFGAVLIIVQPLVVKRLTNINIHEQHLTLVLLATLIISVYSGYFGAGSGVLIFAVYAVMFNGGSQRANALKSLVSVASNIVAATYFALTGPVNWTAVALLASGAFIGGQVGVRIAKRLSDKYLRIALAVGGVIAAIYAVR